ncbi:hypothetical protein Hanom_Chr12g01167281 [Helianthus anomalus]
MVKLSLFRGCLDRLSTSHFLPFLFFSPFWKSHYQLISLFSPFQNIKTSFQHIT